MSSLTKDEMYDLWLKDDSPVLSFSECLICKAEGYPGQIGHSTQSCLADYLKEHDD